MTATSAHQKTVCDAIAALGGKITLHSGDPGTTGANLITTSPASGTTTWGASADGAGGDTGKAVATGSAVTLQVPASTTASHYGIWSGSTFLRGHALDASIATNANAVNVDVTPKTKYIGGQ
ncbi:MAG: hypothetical protein ACRDTI_20870 [Mycobacterium sp.]